MALTKYPAVEGMHMADPIPQFTHFMRSLVAAHPDLA
jgi:hypothetical protein